MKDKKPLKSPTESPPEPGTKPLSGAARYLRFRKDARESYRHGQHPDPFADPAIQGLLERALKAQEEPE